MSHPGLPVKQIWRIFSQIFLAIQYLHEKLGICHRDLSCNNVLVSPHTLSVKVADFGLAKQTKNEEESQKKEKEEDIVNANRTTSSFYPAGGGGI